MRDSIKQGVVLLLATSLVIAVGTVTVGAQGMPPGQQPPPGQTQQAAVSQGDLEAFAGAYIQISRISKDYEPRIGEAGSVERAQQLQLEANEKMTHAIKNEGLTVPEYNEIFKAVQQDPQLEQELMAVIREMR